MQRIGRFFLLDLVLNRLDRACGKPLVHVVVIVEVNTQTERRANYYQAQGNFIRGGV